MFRTEDVFVVLLYDTSGRKLSTKAATSST